MVLGAKNTMKGPGKGRISVMKLQNLAAHKRHSLARMLYGTLLIMISIILTVIDPLTILTDLALEIKEGKLVYEEFREPTYDVFVETSIFNYTNFQAFVDGTDSKLKLEEIGPFTFNEKRIDENMVVDNERGVLSMKPRITLKFIRERSVAHYKDVNVVVPNLVLISFGTFLADKMGYLTNAGAYYSLKGIGAKLILNMTAEEWLWGYKDPLVSLANKLIPSWIDFEKTGILDRFYAYKNNTVEIEIKNKTRKYAINLWNKSPGFVQQGYKNWETSNKCNRLRDTYEGIMVSPGLPKDKTLNIFRHYGCKVFPFDFTDEVNFQGLKSYRFDLQDSAFNRNSSYACSCTKNCVPDGFMDISGCYYGFPIALSKPHFQDVDPKQLAFYEGMNPEPSAPISYALYEPVTGAPLKAFSRLQINLAVRTSPANPITRPVKDMVLPLLNLKMYCDKPPKNIMDELTLRFLIGPPALIITVLLLFVSGTYLGVRGFYGYFNSDSQVTLNDVESKICVDNRKNSGGLLTDNIQREIDSSSKEEALLLSVTADSTACRSGGGV